MPGMGGANCLEHLTANHAEARIVIASGYSPEGTVAETLKRGARGFVAKPYHLQALLKKAITFCWTCERLKQNLRCST